MRVGNYSYVNANDIPQTIPVFPSWQRTECPRSAGRSGRCGWVGLFKELAKASNTLIIPSNLNDVASFIASAMTVLDRAKAGADAQRAAKTQ